MEPYSWQFTTAGVGTCPCTLFSSSAVPTTVDSGDAGAVELGVGFTPTTDGQITGLRFYKSGLNTGTHTGTLWSLDAARCSRPAPSPGSRPPAGRRSMFSQPVAVTAGTTYVASYHAPNGHYSATGGFFADPYTQRPAQRDRHQRALRLRLGGDLPDRDVRRHQLLGRPGLPHRHPAGRRRPPSSRRRRRRRARRASRSSTTPDGDLRRGRRPGHHRVHPERPTAAPSPASVAYDAATRTATFTPDADLARGVTFSAAVSARTAPATPWHRRTRGPSRRRSPTRSPGCARAVCGPDSTQPTTLTDVDARQRRAGNALLRRHRRHSHRRALLQGPGRTPGCTPCRSGPTTARCLATATAAAESSTGWQYVPFAAPVAVTAGTSYVVSYLAPGGKFSSISRRAGRPRSTCRRCTPQADAGRYAYGTGGFPANTSSSSYLVDPVFVDAAPPADTTAPAITAVAAAVDGTSATITWTTDESATSEVAYGTSASDLSSSASGATGTSHTVNLTGLTAGTTYHYRVTSADAAGNSATAPDTGSPPGTFDVAPAADTTAPAITAVAAAVDGTSATITWTTDESATSEVAYGTSASDLSSSASGATGTSHTVNLTGLTAGTTYYYRVTSADAAGNSATSPDTGSAPGTFDVAPAADTTAPAITAVCGHRLGDGGHGHVDDRRGVGLHRAVRHVDGPWARPAPAPPARATRWRLTGLTPNTRYYYRVTSVDAAGNCEHLTGHGQRPGPVRARCAARSCSAVPPTSPTGSGGYVADDSGGEVIAAPTEGYEFSGGTLPAGLTTTARHRRLGHGRRAAPPPSTACWSRGTPPARPRASSSRARSPRGTSSGCPAETSPADPGDASWCSRDGSLVTTAAASNRDVRTTSVAGHFDGQPPRLRGPPRLGLHRVVPRRRHTIARQHLRNDDARSSDGRPTPPWVARASRWTGARRPVRRLVDLPPAVVDAGAAVAWTPSRATSSPRQAPL